MASLLSAILVSWLWYRNPEDFKQLGHVHLSSKQHIWWFLSLCVSCQKCNRTRQLLRGSGHQSPMWVTWVTWLSFYKWQRIVCVSKFPFQKSSNLQNLLIIDLKVFRVHVISEFKTHRVYGSIKYHPCLFRLSVSSTCSVVTTSTTVLFNRLPSLAVESIWDEEIDDKNRSL